MSTSTSSQRGGEGHSSDGGDGGEDEEPSSSSSSSSVQWNVMPLVTHDDLDPVEKHGETEHVPKEATGNDDITGALDRFRCEWQEELLSRSGSSSGVCSRDVSRGVSPIQELPRKPYLGRKSDDKFDKAKNLFLEGIEQEKKGDMYQAIRYYRQSLQLVPDIERRLFQQVTSHPKRPISCRNSLEKMRSPASRGYTQAPESESEIDSPLDYDALQSRLYHDGEKIYCKPEIELPEGMGHISRLPVEVILRIFRWVVSSELDLRMLEQMGRVCSGYFLLSREPELWHSACMKTWGIRTSVLENNHWETWRDMYVARPRVWHNGAYISKMTYVRAGDTGFQDQFYRPWHLVTYYRYIRFFADGTILMLTTPDEPTAALPLLKSRTPRSSQVLIGSFQFVGKDTVSAVLKRSKKNLADGYGGYSYHGRRKLMQNLNNDPEHIFNLGLQIGSTKRKLHAQLSWLNYEIVTKYRCGSQSSSCFDLTDQAFPPFYFSRVKSFAAKSNAPLN